MRPGATAALAAAVALAACGEARTPREGSAVPVLALGGPVLEIGVLEGDEHYTFQDVTGLLPLASGGVVVADGGASELSLYAPDGSFVRRWGRLGQGPGEFRMLSRVYPWPGDSVAALEGTTGRLSVFDSAGAFARQTSANVLSGDSLFGMDVWLYGRFWVDGALRRDERSRVRRALAGLAPPASPPGYRVVRVASDGRLWIREPGARPDGTRAWTVLGASGRPEAVVDVPVRLDPQYLGARRVLGRWLGESDVNFVRRYRIEDTGRTEPLPAWLSAPPASAPTRGPAESDFLDAIREALKRMAVAQEIHYADHGTYTSEIDSLDWERSENLVVDVVTAGTRGWTAVFTHPALDRICGLGYGFTVPPGWPNGGIVCGPPATPPAG